MELQFTNKEIKTEKQILLDTIMGSPNQKGTKLVLVVHVESKNGSDGKYEIKYDHFLRKTVVLPYVEQFDDTLRNGNLSIIEFRVELDKKDEK